MSTTLSCPKTEPGLMSVLHELMEKNNITVSQLSKNTNLANTTIKRICTNPDSNPTLSSITKIADFFGITQNQLIGNEPLPNENVDYFPSFDRWHQIPVVTLSQVISWPKNIAEIRNASETRFVWTEVEVSEEAFAIIAKNDTLEPRFSNGSILIFDPIKKPSNKDYVILLMEGKDSPQFRRILIDGPDLYAKNINPEIPDTTPFLLVKNKFKLLGALIQAKSTYI